MRTKQLATPDLETPLLTRNWARPLARSLAFTLSRFPSMTHLSGSDNGRCLTRASQLKLQSGVPASLRADLGFAYTTNFKEYMLASLLDSIPYICTVAQLQLVKSAVLCISHTSYPARKARRPCFVDPRPHTDRLKTQRHLLAPLVVRLSCLTNSIQILAWPSGRSLAQNLHHQYP